MTRTIHNEIGPSASRHRARMTRSNDAAFCIDYDGQVIEFSTDGWINGTAATALRKKRLDNWLRLSETKRYMRALADALNTLNVRDLLRTTRGRNGGTWLHPKLAVSLSGMTAVEAAQRFGYKNSTQISLIESGGRPTPRDHQFLRQASQVYAVSCDFLLGLSPHMEFDGRVARQHALVRGTEQILGNIAAQFATVMIKFTEETKPIPDDFQSVSTAAENVARTLAVMREKYGLDDMRGSASLVASVEKLARAVEPLRRKIAHYRSIDAYFDELRAGKLPPIAYLTERYSEHQLGLDG